MMKSVFAASLLTPGMALAHGGHVALPDALHSINHATFAVSLAAIALAVCITVLQRRKS